MPQKNSKKPTQKKDQMMVILENMQDSIQLIAEGHSVLGTKIDRIETRMGNMETRMDRIETKVDNIETRVGNIETKVDNIETRVGKIETRVGKIETKMGDIDSNFQTVFAYLSRIEDEILEIKKDLKENYERKGWDIKWRKMIETKLEKLEKAVYKTKIPNAEMIRDKRRKK